MYKNRVALLRLSTNTHWSAVQQVRVFKANFFYTRPHSWLVVKGKVCREPSWRQQIQLLKTRHISPISICSDYVHSMYSVHCTLPKNHLNLAGHGWSGCTLYSMFGFVNIYLFQKADILYWTVYSIHTVASAPILRGYMCKRRFRLFLGQCRRTQVNLDCFQDSVVRLHWI